LVWDSGIERSLSEILKQPVSIRLTHLSVHDTPGHSDGFSGLRLRFAEPSRQLNPAGTAASTFVLTVENALAVAAVALALQQPAQRLSLPSKPISDRVVGAFAAIVCAAIRRSPRPVPVHFIDAVYTDKDLKASTDTSTVDAQFAVRIGSEVFAARIACALHSVAMPTTPRALTRSDLRRLGHVPLRLHLVMASAPVSLAQLAALEAGDGLMFSKSHESPLIANLDGSLQGRVMLAAPGSKHGMEAQLVSPAQLVIGNRLVAVSTEEALQSTDTQEFVRSVMSDTQTANDATAATLALDSVSVNVRVELGTVEMTAGEWANLEPGDALRLEKKIGEPAVLRIGEREFARGELISIDGDYGVRIVSLSTPTP